ncbi:MAG: BatA and WFA domain-containing protein, partial [Candidatus Pacebacteria bacterium]|nr:BatA and WFA domain-containing protein [Candidatus Paceibacterota bacterium]
MLSFQYPQFLLAGLGLGIPLVLHLMKRQFALTLTFPSIRFIMQGRLPHTGRRRLRDILLLMLRLLLFALIVLALARPQWVSETSPAVVSKTGTETAVIVIDTSASMAGWQGLTGAKAIARELIQSREDTSFGLLLSADGVVGQVALAEQNTTLLSMLDKARPHPVAGNHLP